MSSIGMSASAGTYLSDWDHVLQSVDDIITTPVGSRVLRRDYGSELQSLVDQDMTASVVLKIYSAVASALARWEPRIGVKKVLLAAASAKGNLTIIIHAEYYPNGHKGDRLTVEQRQAFGVVLTRTAGVPAA